MGFGDRRKKLAFGGRAFGYSLVLTMVSFATGKHNTLDYRPRVLGFLSLEVGITSCWWINGMTSLWAENSQRMPAAPHPNRTLAFG